jgi:hypothetical protein
MGLLVWMALDRLLILVLEGTIGIFWWSQSSREVMTGVRGRINYFELNYFDH